MSSLDKILRDAITRAWEDHAGLRPFDRIVYHQLATYAFDEATCHPSQALLAEDLGVSRPTITRAIARLIKAGWVRVSERRWSPRTGWPHNVYDLLGE